MFINLTAQELVTDRPDQTESSSTVPMHSLQIESGLVLNHERKNSITNRQLIFPSTLFRYGLTSYLEIRILNQFESIENSYGTDKILDTGFSDIEVGTKVQILKNANTNTEIAFLTHLIIPTGSSGFSIGKVGSINKLSISHSINDKIDLGYNIGYDYLGTGSGSFTYSIVTGFSITEKLGLYLEAFGELEEFTKYIANFDAGLTYLIKKNLQIDFSFGTGINHKMNYLSIGFSWNISE